MPASSALSTGSVNADLSTTASARPSALPLIAVFVALTISATTESFDPVHWNAAPSSAHASAAPYCVGVKNGFVVTWQTKTNFHLGVFGKLPDAPRAPARFVRAGTAARAPASRAAASEALVRPAPVSSRRRVSALRPRVSTASSTLG